MDIPLSTSLRKKARNKPVKSTAGAIKVKGRKKEQSTPLQEGKGSPRSDSASAGGQVSKVTLTSGGDVTLAVNVDLFRLSREDRDFVLKLVDIVKGYNKKEESAEGNVPF